MIDEYNDTIEKWGKHTDQWSLCPISEKFENWLAISYVILNKIIPHVFSQLFNQTVIW